MLFVDAANNVVGIGTNTPQAPLDVIGNIRSGTATSATFMGNGVFDTNRSDGMFLIQSANAAMSFYTNNTERGQFDATGNLLVGTTTSPSGSGQIVANGGVYLGGTGSANLLDDYEEGTFTPQLADATTGGNTATGAFFAGSYTKIGRVVVCNISFLNIVKTGMTSGNVLYFRNLPFATNPTSPTGGAHGAVRCDRINFTNYVTAQTTSNTTYGSFVDNIDSAGNVTLTVSSVTSSGESDLFFTLTYMTA
jgi:hypothetical protein